jgi:ABC-type branched-subunit amino acid transport system ATPase component
VRDDKLNPGEAATRTLELVASSSAVFPPRFNLRLAGRLDQEAVTMSGGEQQMLAIARAMIARPDLIMLDEPSEGIMPVSTKCLNVSHHEGAGNHDSAGRAERGAGA